MLAKCRFLLRLARSLRRGGFLYFFHFANKTTTVDRLNCPGKPEDFSCYRLPAETTPAWTFLGQDASLDHARNGNANSSYASCTHKTKLPDPEGQSIFAANLGK